MNKTERDRLLGYISKGRFFGRETVQGLEQLRDYVDALEAACERIARLNEIYVTPAGAGNHAIKVAREALAKEK